EEQIVNTLDTNNAAADDISGSEKMKEWLDELENIELEVDRNEEVTIDTTEDAKEDLDTTYDNENALKHENTKEEGASMDDNVDLELLNSLSEEEKQVEDTEKEQKVKAASVSKDEEVSIITKGTSINGSITSDNSLDVY